MEDKIIQKYVHLLSQAVFDAQYLSVTIEELEEKIKELEEENSNLKIRLDLKDKEKEKVEEETITEEQKNICIKERK